MLTNFLGDAGLKALMSDGDKSAGVFVENIKPSLSRIRTSG